MNLFEMYFYTSQYLACLVLCLLILASITGHYTEPETVAEMAANKGVAISVGTSTISTSIPCFSSLGKKEKHYGYYLSFLHIKYLI